jgi:hypothetical protein
MSMTLTQTLTLGVVGGLLPDIIRIVRDRHNKELPAFLKSSKFYISLVLLAALGGFAAWLLDAASYKDAVIYGFTAPEALSKLAGTSAGEADRGRGQRTMTVREWWGK